MNFKVKLLVGVLGAQVLAATPALAGTKDFALQGYALPADKPVTITLLRPDVDIGELAAGGLPQPNADWTNQARANIEKALKEELAGRQITFTAMEDSLAKWQAGQEEIKTCLAKRAEAEAAAKAAAAAAPAPVAVPASATAAAPASTSPVVVPVPAPPLPSCPALDAGGDPGQTVAEYRSLHKAVIDAILANHYGLGGGKLPTKKNNFTYTMGPGTSQLGRVSGANYGLFVMTYDQFASASRKAMQVVGALGCLIGACVIVGGGIHVGYVSLVELDTGNVVWFNLLRGSQGDVREEQGARDMVKAVLAGMPSRPGERTAQGDDPAAAKAK